MRVIVSGSRTWDTEFKVVMVLNELWALADVLASPLTIVHGACPTGADQIADQWASDRSEIVRVEHWPANWKAYGKSAGPRRNEAMVDSGADMLVAFLRDGSLGTRSAIALARTAKIPTFVIHYDEDHPFEESNLDALR